MGQHRSTGQGPLANFWVVFGITDFSDVHNLDFLESHKLIFIDEFNILFIGSVTDRKKPRMINEAINLLQDKNINISKIKRDFLTNSSCGVCGKSSLDALEIIKTDKTDPDKPKINKEVIISSSNTLKTNQSEFSKTGGIHASGLLNSKGELINLKEDVGRHNALDKLIGSTLINDQIEPKNQFITCSGRLNFELVQKVLMTNIGIMIGVGAPTSLAIDLANKFDMTLIGFVKKDSFNVYTNNKKVIVD